MNIDSTTYQDLSIFHTEEDQSIFHKINLTKTLEGRAWLLKYFNSPFNSLQQIYQTQQTLKLLQEHRQQWPESISNGTLMVMEKFFESQIDPMPERSNTLQGAIYKLLHAPDYALTRYSLEHFAIFLQGMHQLAQLFPIDKRTKLTAPLIERIESLLKPQQIQALMQRRLDKKFTSTEVIYYGKFIRDSFKLESFELINLFGRFDAWRAMTEAMQQFNLSFPEFIDCAIPIVDAQQLYHILLPEAIPYDVHMHRESNFVFLTGANMAGKSTFIKSIGASVFLAHLGMGVPAKKFRLSLFDGLLSNINVVDNIIKGESYFFNEVQRIKNTILKINDGKKWLVLIDELFKGTNVQDAMKCSTAVIKGLIKIKNSLFILSTHLYEIGEALKEHPTIAFRYFETTVTDDQLHFSYHLKEGISNDRLGYLILKRENVVDLLEHL